MTFPVRSSARGQAVANSIVVSVCSVKTLAEPISADVCVCGAVCQSFVSLTEQLEQQYIWNVQESFDTHTLIWNRSGGEYKRTLTQDTHTISLNPYNPP